MGLFDIFKRKNKEEYVDIHILHQQMSQNVFDILQEYLPNNWKEVIFFVGYYKDDSGYFKYWIKMENDKYIDCFNLIPDPKPGEKDCLQEQLMRLHNELKFLRSKLSNHDKWVCMEMSVSNQGKMSQKYDYAEGIAQEDYKQYVEEYKNNLNKKFSN